MKKSPILTIILSLIILLGGCAQDSDIHFARRSFQALVQGRHKAQKMIDWENFQALGVNVGATYAAFSNIQERADYQKSLIAHLSRAFRQGAGRVSSFTDWRLYGRSSEGAVVIACDYRAKGKTLLLTISNNGQRKLLALQWEQGKDDLK